MWEKIRRFGLEYCDLPTMIWNVDFMMRFCAVNIDRRNKKSIPILFYITSFMSAIMYYYVFLISVAWFVFVREPAEPVELLCTITVISLGISSENGVTKLIFMLLFEGSIRDIVDDYLACDALVVPGSRFAINMAKTLRVVKKRAMTFWIVIMWNGVLYVVMPLFKPGRHMMEDCFVFYGLEPILESPNYEIAFTVSTVGAWVTCYLPANVTGFFIIITGYLEAQMTALTEEVKQLWNDAQSQCIEIMEIDVDSEVNISHIEEIKTRILNDNIKKLLVNIVKIHMTNINLLLKVKKVFRVIIAAEFLVIIMAIIAELLGGLENTYIQLPYALMIVGVDCLIGQRLMDASIGFENEIYNCKWENFDASNMKIVYLMLMNAQKTLSLTAADVAILSYSCFMSVIRTIYSAFTTLRSTM